MALNGDTRTEVGARLDRIDITERDPSGRAAVITLVGRRAPVVRAEELRTIMRQVFGPRSIRSTAFAVARHGDRFVFTGMGYGHGVGLCQRGAALRAQAGHSPRDIIAHYFPGTQIVDASAALLSFRASGLGTHGQDPQ
jgi:stage II sporulation protein D